MAYSNHQMKVPFVLQLSYNSSILPLLCNANKIYTNLVLLWQQNNSDTRLRNDYYSQCMIGASGRQSMIMSCERFLFIKKAVSQHPNEKI